MEKLRVPGLHQEGGGTCRRHWQEGWLGEERPATVAAETSMS